MVVYLGIDAIIILTGLLLSQHKVRCGKREIDGAKWYFIITIIVLSFFSAFRGDFSADYNGYAKEIWLRFYNYSAKAIVERGYLSNPEPGYLLFQHVIQRITDKSIYIFIISSLLIVVSNICEIKRSKVLPYLAVFLFLEVGNYYGSFNLMRQIMAVSIVVLGSKYLFERRFWKYLFFVFIASTFHVSALIMIPFYFIGGLKLGRRSIIVYPIAMLILLFAQERLMTFAGQYIWSWYNIGSGGYSWKNVVASGLISAIALGLYYTNRNNEYECSSVEGINPDLSLSISENIYISATFFFLLFKLMGFYFSYSNRFSTYFSLYAIIFCCQQIEKSRMRNLLIAGVIVFFIVFGFVTKLDIPFYFIWDK